MAGVEIMIMRAWTLIAILVCTGILIQLRPKSATNIIDEPWLEQHLPTVVGDFRAVLEPGKGYSYRIDDRTYGFLKPHGIVARVFEGHDSRFDVLVVTGDNADSFHDPNLCFTSQNWEVLLLGTVQIDTLTRGRVPVTILKVSADGRSSLAAYTYRGVTGMFARPVQLTNDLLINELRTGTIQPGVFYRFIALEPGTSQDQLVEFIRAFLDRTFKDGGGRI